jgi:hypothetical protein
MKKTLIIVFSLFLIVSGVYFLLEKNRKSLEQPNSLPTTPESQTTTQNPEVEKNEEQSVKTSPYNLDAFLYPVSLYNVDEKIVYYNKVKIEAEASSFKVLKGSLTDMKTYIVYNYAKDRNNVYYKGEKLLEVDVNNFQPIENGRGEHNFGTDGKTVYFRDQIVKNADPKTFKILWSTIWEGCEKSHYEKDLNQVYFEANAVPNADAATFETLINGYGKDKNGYFKAIDFIGPSINSDELLCDYG